MELTHRPNGYQGTNPLSYYPELFDRLARIPGVISVSASTLPPVIPPFFSGRKVEANGATAIAQTFLVAPGYFETMQIPLEAGREFSFNDTGQSPNVTIISESLARKLFSSTDVVGKYVTLSGGGPVRLVISGVVKDSYVGSLQAHNPLQLFTSVFQATGNFHDPYLLIRLRGAPSGLLVQQLEVELQGLGREYPIRTETMDQAVGRALAQERLMASLSGGFGVLALLLAAIGLYGLMTYSVTRRTREIGIRMALGAHPMNIARMLISESLLLVVAGFILSLPAVYAGSKLVSKMLYGLRPLDVAPLAIATLVLLVTSLIAVCVPVRRAANLDPIVSLRNE
jgi:putative ABC transport system permease protein